MGLLQKMFGRKSARAEVPVGNCRRIRGKYDAAQTSQENSKHWANADDLGANSANSPEVRRILRKRSRYEIGSNSYAKGMVLTMVNDIVGTGPNLQLRGTTADSANIAKIEREFMAWARQVRLAQKLRTIVHAKKGDGEGFAMFTSNQSLPTPVKLDLTLIEAEQVTTPAFDFSANVVDGLNLDRAGNILSYSVLKEHPGETGLLVGKADAITVPADQMIHLFRADRPGQYRGIPEITPALPLYAFLRRYTLAVVSAAETAANFAAVMQSDAPVGEDKPSVDPLDTIELERGLMTSLPEGWKLGQLDAKQPTNTYDMFKAEIINEIARCLNMPFNVAACNSSKYNYASGRLDHQTYGRNIIVEQAQIALVMLDRVFDAWYAEAILIPNYLPRVANGFGKSWMWEGRDHVDPAKEATAQEKRLANNTTTLAREWGKVGEDWEVQLRQRIREKLYTFKATQEIAEEMGIDSDTAHKLVNPPANPATTPSPSAPQDDTEDDNTPDGDNED